MVMLAVSPPQWIVDLLSGGSIYTLAQELWNFVMNLTMVLLGKNVSDFSNPQTSELMQLIGMSAGTGAWDYVKDTVFPFFLSMGTAFLNIFALAGFCRQASNFKEGITLEAGFELFIKLFIANVLMVNLLDIMQAFTGFAINTSDVFIPNAVPSVVGGDYDAGFRLAMLLVAPIYLIVAAVCSITILLEVLGRFLNLFMLISTAPVAMSTIAGGKGFEATAAAWFKSFLTNTLQIVVIVLVIQIATRINWSLTSFMNVSGLGNWFDGAVPVVGALIFMPFMATAVKASDTFLKRSFALN